MAMGRLSNRLTAPRSGSRLAVDLAPRHAFYDWCNEVLAEAEFDEAVEMLCQPHYQDGVGRPSIPPGRYFRMLFVGQFEGLESEREIAWRCADSLSLHRFLRLGERVPDHSTLSVTRSRLPLEHAVFSFILEIADKHDLVPARRIGVDASTQEANAALRPNAALRRLVRRDTGEDYQEMLHRLARASGIETPSTADLIRFDRARRNKTLSNADWETDPAARIAKMKDGTTHLGYKPEHAVDLDTAVIVAAKIHLADQGDTQPLPSTLAHAEAMLDLIGAAPEAPAELIADTGYHS